MSATLKTVMEMILPRLAIVLSSGEGTGLFFPSIPAIFPISVSEPVAVTTHRAEPFTQKVEK